MTFEELMGVSLAHAATAENLLSRATQSMLAGDYERNIGLYLSMANSYAILSESFARLASAQVVNGTSMNQLMGQLPQGGTS